MFLKTLCLAWNRVCGWLMSCQWLHRIPYARRIPYHRSFHQFMNNIDNARVQVKQIKLSCFDRGCCHWGFSCLESAPSTNPAEANIIFAQKQESRYSRCNAVTTLSGSKSGFLLVLYSSVDRRLEAKRGIIQLSNSYVYERSGEPSAIYTMAPKPVFRHRRAKRNLMVVLSRLEMSTSSVGTVPYTSRYCATVLQESRCYTLSSSVREAREMKAN